MPLLDYVDFMIESGPISRVNNLEKLQLKPLKYIDNQAHLGQGDNILYTVYDVQPLSMRWREHIGCIMYRLSRSNDMIDDMIVDEHMKPTW